MPKSVTEKKAALLAALEKIEALEKEQEQKSFAIIGRAVTDEADNNAEFDSKLRQILDAKVRKNSEREVLGLEKIKSNRGRPTT